MTKRADLSQLSVVILTYQRPTYALRNMHLFDQTGARIHILDGSESPIDPSRIAVLSDRVNYLHRPASYEERRALAMDMVDTPFCVTLGDDDIHLPSGLAASLAALSKDPDLVAATGTALTFLPAINGEVRGKLMYDKLHGRAIMDNDPVDRMTHHLSDYLPSTVYAVTRTPVWKRAVRALTARRFAPFRLGELQYEMTVTYAGKTKVVPQLMWLRSQENKSLWKADEVALESWWKAGDDRDEFAAYMGQVLTDDPAEQRAAGQGSLRAMDTYIRVWAERAALRKRMSPAERRERWPIHPELPLAEWGRKIAEQGIAVDDADLAAAIAAIAATPAELGEDLPAAWTGRPHGSGH